MIQELSEGIFVGESGAFFIENYSASSKSSKNEEQSTLIKVNKSEIDTEKTKTSEVVSWGPSNSGPKKVLELIAKIGVAGKAVQVATAAHFGTGLSVYEEDDKGELIKKPFRAVPGLNEFDKRNNINLFYSEFINDLEIHDLGFVEFCLLNNYEDVRLIKRHDPIFCRFEVMNESTGKIENVYLNPDWTNYNEKYTSKVPCFSQYDYWEDIKDYCKQKGYRKFIIPFHYVKNGVIYYNKPMWHAPLLNGWADIILSVPEVKKRIAEQALNFQYLVHISEKYFIQKFGKNQHKEDVWEKFTPEERKNKTREVVTAMDKHLKGKEAAGRSMMVPMVKGPDGKEEKTIIIEPIENKIKEGAMLPDASAGNTEILFAKGIPPAIVGVAIPGSNNGGRSGSDIREGYTVMCANMVINRTISLLPFYLIRDWNNWGDNLVGAFANTILTTLDKETSGATETTPS